MSISVKILADSIAPCGKRLTTKEWRYPRSIHSEIMTHKMLSKNSASSRAIPTPTLITRVVDDPFVPKYIGANQKGMQAGEELSEEQKTLARKLWLDGRDNAVDTARKLLELGIHKQVVNRIIEPWMWITIIVSGTEWDNVWGLRCHEMAEPHFQELAYMSRDAMKESTPKQLKEGQWHTPLAPVDDEDTRAISQHVVLTSTTPEERTGVGLSALLTGGQGFADDGALATRLKAEVEKTLLKISVGRCARVSYLTHDGRRAIEEDIALHDRLVVQTPLHASPAEHVAQAMDYPRWYREASGGKLLPLGDLQQQVLARRATFVATHANVADEAVLAQMRSGNLLGWRSYRKTLANEHIGGLMP